MIRIADIRQEWPRIKDAVTALCHDGIDRPEDVYAACKHDVAILLVCDEGFAVVALETMQHTGRKQLFIWKLYCPGGLGTDLQAEFEEQARKWGATSLYMGSPRAGWRNIEGWSEETTFYRRVL